KRVSISLDGLLLGLADSGPAVANFLEFCQSCEVFAFSVADSDAREAQVLQMLDSLGARRAGFKRHRLMFSSTQEGRVSMVRQLQPDLHLEASPEVAEALLGKVPDVRVVESLPRVEEALAL
ncbi:PEX22, partial [Symbiodinium pilosum]